MVAIDKEQREEVRAGERRDFGVCRSREAEHFCCGTGAGGTERGAVAVGRAVNAAGQAACSGCSASDAPTHAASVMLTGQQPPCRWRSEFCANGAANAVLTRQHLPC